MQRFVLAFLALLPLLAQPTDPRSTEAASLYKQARAAAPKDPHAAIGLYLRALELRTATGERFDEALVAHNLAAAYWDVAANDLALQYYTRALHIREELKDSIGLGYTHYGIALVHWTWGDAAEALASYDRALALWREQNNIAGQADVLNATGLALMSLGEKDRAEDRYRQALPLWAKAKHAVGEGYTRSNLGMLYLAGGHAYSAGVEYARALELLTAAQDRRGIAYVRHNLGDVSVARGEFVDALAHYGASLALKRMVDDKYGIALTLTRLARAELATFQTDAALATATNALSLHREAANRTGETATLALLSRIATARGDAAAAERYSAEAVELSERTRAAISSDELRTSYFATQRELYAQLISLRMAAGKHGEALETSEHSRARVLLDAVADVRPANHPLLRETERLIRAAVQRRNTKAANELLHRWSELAAGLRAGGRSAAPEPAGLREIRRKLLGPGAALLEYFAGDREGYAWLVTPTQLYTAKLPARTALEHMVRDYRRALTARAQSPASETADARAARIAFADKQLSATARALSNALLTPFARHLTARRLLVVPDGPLHQIPFAALPVAEGAIIDRAEVVTLPSASLAIELRGKAPARATGLTVVAGPAFNSAWAPLPMTEFEGQAIARLAPGARQLGGTAATRAALLKPPSLDARILHLATHARAESEHPALSRIALAGGDELTLADIYGLPLRSRLVVLSGCETALGRQVAGEGPVGLARAFFYAGAHTVVASLWNVQDRATAELMRRFYEAHLQRGLPPAAALRGAQLALRNDARWSHAYYWAPFLAAGDWR